MTAGARLVPPSSLPSAGPGLLVAFDVDGTLLTHSGECRPAVGAAVDALARAGAHVVIATGRGVASTMPILQEIGVRTGYAVCSNGAMTIRLDPDLPEGFELVDVVTFDPEPTLRRLHALVPGALFLHEDAHMVRRITAPFPDGELLGAVEVTPFEELCRVSAARVTLRAPDLALVDMHRVLDSAGLHGVSYAVGWTAWVDVAPEGVSKATALERVRGLLGVGPGGTVAVGDGNNDHEMLAWAAWSLAMGQASEATKALATGVAPPVEADGVAAVVSALLDRPGPRT